MSRFLKIIAIMGLALSVVPTASAQRGFGRRVIVRPYFFGGGFGPGYYWGPGAYYPWGETGPGTGEVKIDTGRKDVSVYVDGGFVGPINKFKKFDLLPGNHDIELHDAGNQVIFHEKVQVLLGKTTELRSPV
jgi:hypothetical protein